VSVPGPSLNQPVKIDWISTPLVTTIGVLYTIVVLMMKRYRSIVVGPCQTGTTTKSFLHVGLRAGTTSKISISTDRSKVVGSCREVVIKPADQI
jgi:hypothetical protein